jgi:hypothetical protein
MKTNDKAGSIDDPGPLVKFPITLFSDSNLARPVNTG